MNETILTILQWLIPTGGVVSIASWFVGRTVRKSKQDKEIHDAYKLMYEDVRKTLIEIKDEKRKIYQVAARFEKAANRCFTCKHYDMCPVAFELQKHKTADCAGDLGYVALPRKNNRRARDNPSEPGDPEGVDERPP